MERRKFLKFLSYAPIIGGGAIIAASAKAQERRPDIKNAHISFCCPLGTTHMGVGENGTLWLSDGKTWRKVATE